ncbi:hypothetical protein CA54_34530 [Symmachiella macrocystis]|uniref:Uncharacterized protein n=1 Tax=Symmachiella macrocystis TaxID=2527985 RepID=A0A5C6BV77_9PLAN|nr:hypothetical protein [Symmachiella macrocystis]TWU14584.1 hypothetical protein CA54_34530 [Symmachiella macrocystis]
MTTDKPKWWQSLVVYAIVALLVTVGPYVGGYLLLGEYSQLFMPDMHNDLTFHTRRFKSKTESIVFFPLAWVEAKVRSENVIVYSPVNADFYEPGW